MIGINGIWDYLCPSQQIWDGEATKVSSFVVKLCIRAQEGNYSIDTDQGILTIATKHIWTEYWSITTVIKRCPNRLHKQSHNTHSKAIFRCTLHSIKGNLRDTISTSMIIFQHIRMVFLSSSRSHSLVPLPLFSSPCYLFKTSSILIQLNSSLISLP